MPWVKGQSGNPNGRPKRKPVTDAIIAELQKVSGKDGLTKAQQGARKLVQLMLAGDVRAAKLILAYVEGLPAQPVHIDITAEAERMAAEAGVDPRKVISIYERLVG